jgi:hypothetical protein
MGGCYHESMDRNARQSIVSPLETAQIGGKLITKSKDLRTGRAIWEQNRAPGVPHRPLKRNIQTEVLVIGAGITGAMVADALTASAGTSCWWTAAGPPRARPRPPPRWCNTRSTRR